MHRPIYSLQTSQVRVAVAVARQNRIKEGDNETAEIREYMATLPFRGISRATTGANPKLDKGLSAADAIEL